MRVAYFTGLRSIEIRRQPEPVLQRPDEVLLAIDRVGICGSDVHYFREGRIGDQLLQLPATLGHECAGTVVAVGSAVERLQPGDRVAVDPALSCGQCDQCQRGRPNTCRKLQFLGCPGQAPGAVSDRLVLPADNCLRIPDTMSLEQAVLAEPLSIGLYAVKLAQLFPGAKVAILGAGPIGLSVLLCAKALLPLRAYVTEPIPERRAIARQCGADWVGDPVQEDPVASLLAQESLGLDLVFECSGNPDCIAQAMHLLAPGGTFVLVGIPAATEIRLDVHLMRRKEIAFLNVRRQAGCVGPVLRMMDEGRLDATPLLTHRFPLAQIQEAFELVAAYQDGVIKAILELSEP